MARSKHRRVRFLIKLKRKKRFERRKERLKLAKQKAAEQKTKLHSS